MVGNGLVRLGGIILNKFRAELLILGPILKIFHFFYFWDFRILGFF